MKMNELSITNPEKLTRDLPRVMNIRAYRPCGCWVSVQIAPEWQFGCRDDCPEMIAEATAEALATTCRKHDPAAIRARAEDKRASRFFERG